MDMLTTKDAAERLGVTVQRIHALIKGDRLPAQKVGRDYLIKVSDLALVSDRKPGRPPKEKDAALAKAAVKSTGKTRKRS